MSSPLLRLMLFLRALGEQALLQLFIVYSMAGLLLLLLIVYIWLNVDDSEHVNECEHAEEHDDLLKCPWRQQRPLPQCESQL